jgi:hypothetical protein
VKISPPLGQSRRRTPAVEGTGRIVFEHALPRGWHVDRIVFEDGRASNWAASSLSYGYAPNAPLVASNLVELLIAVWDVTLANYPSEFEDWPQPTRPATFIGQRPRRGING